jgi:hypothetical protein
MKLDLKEKLIEHLKTNGQKFLNQIDSTVKFQYFGELDKFVES